MALRGFGDAFAPLSDKPLPVYRGLADREPDEPLASARVQDIKERLELPGGPEVAEGAQPTP